MSLHQETPNTHGVFMFEMLLLIAITIIALSHFLPD